MKKFWTKKVPAFLLALTLVVSLMPAAMAVDEHEHQYPTEWQRDSTQHWRVCTVPECNTEDRAAHTFAVTSQKDPTCYQPGETVSACSVCGYQKTESFAATGNHSYSADWTSDNTNHWRACTTPGCTQKTDSAGHTPNGNGTVKDATCTEDGLISYASCSICAKPYTTPGPKALGHSLNTNGLCTRCNKQITSNITVSFQTGGSAIAPLSIAPGTAPGNPGTPTKTAGNRTYAFYGWTEQATSTYVYTGTQTVYRAADMAARALNANTTYYALYTVSASSQSASLSLNSTGATTIGSSIRSQINSAFSSVVGANFTRVRFSSPSGTNIGTLYTNSSRTQLYTNVDYTYSGGSYPMDSLYFQPTGTRGTYTIPFTAYDAIGNAVAGTCSIAVNASGTASTISYSVAPGGQVAFRANDFYNAFQAVYPGTGLQWVTFTTSDTLDTTNGTVYHNYNANNSVAFNRSTISSYNYYYNTYSNQYTLGGLSFVAGTNATNRTVTLSYRAYGSNSVYVDGKVEITISGSASNRIIYNVAAGQQVSFNAADFNNAYRNVYSGNIRWITLSTSSSLDSSIGTVYYRYGKSNSVAFNRSTLSNYKYYYSSSSYGTYDMTDLSFVAGTSSSAQTVLFSYRALYSDSSYVDGTVEIRINGSGSKTFNYDVRPGESVTFDSSDFNKAYQNVYNDTIRWVTFSANTNLDNSGGTLYYNYGRSNQRSFNRNELNSYKYYYSSSSYGDYALDSLSFVAGSGFTSTLTLSFRAHYSNDYYVDGTLTITPKAVETKGDIVYYATYGTNLQLNPNDFARFLEKKYAGYGLQYVRIDGIPNKGALHYNYYGVSGYGAKKLQLTSGNCSSQLFYFSPTSTSQYSLSDLTYVPSSSNYCTAIPFTAYSSNGGRSVSGNILISVSYSAVAEVYGVTTKGSSVTLPGSAISAAVSSATGSSLSSIRFLSLPSPSSGALYENGGTSTRADTDTLYNLNAINQLRFVPASNFIGSVELPYVAYNSSGTAMVSGKVCLGVVNRVAKFKDMSSSTWCYKYVTELSDASVINGYEDGAFRPDGTVTYGAALKLIMLSSGYSVQKPTGSHVFSGYLSRAKSDGLISGTVDLNKPITRLAVAQLAAKAMRLSTGSLSSAKPFTDTSDPYVQALNAAGIVEGYFANGTSTFKPGNTLTRGQISAIVWRMERANG